MNLVLRVGPRRADGYHELATLLVALDVGDELALEPAAATTVEAPALPGGDTLVTDALRRLAEAAGHDGGWRVTIDKRVPAGAGLGGGSSDAGTALRLANATLPRPLDREALLGVAAAVGSDVPFFVTGATAAVATGRGEDVRPVELTSWPVVALAWPGVVVPTSTVYAAFRPDPAFGDAAAHAVRAAGATTSALPALVHNDLAAAAEAVSPATGALVRELRGRGARAATVAGSGSAAFGLFEDLAAARRALDGLPGAAWSAVARPLAGSRVSA